MFQKINEKKENQNRNENKVYVSCDKNERNFNCDSFFARFDLKKHDNLNKEEHEAKSKQIIKKTLFQQIRNALLKAKKQYKLIREKKAL